MSGSVDDPDVGVIVVAAGSGTRLGLDRPKAFVPLVGRTILERALDAVFGMRRPARVVVVVPETELADAASLVQRAAGAATAMVGVVSGGATRQDSVAAGLIALPASVRTVLVHDAARALTPTAVFERVVDGVAASRAGVIPVLPVVDTIKQTDPRGAVTMTLDRASLAAVQTPQGFPRALIDAAYEQADAEYTDDAAVVSAAGGDVTTVEGDALAFKITTPWDLRRAESLLGQASAPTSAVRTGVGMDVHAYDPAAPLWLGGLFWPDEPGLAGHSDGDAVSHAVCDALLSASGLGDIGSRFGTDDPRYAGAHGDVFLEATAALLAQHGWRIGNVAVQVVAQRPRLSARRGELEEHLGGILGAPVSVSATTTDGLGFTGRGDGLAAIVTAPWSTAAAATAFVRLVR